jgi:hypothetical protein
MDLSLKAAMQKRISPQNNMYTRVFDFFRLLIKELTPDTAKKALKGHIVFPSFKSVFHKADSICLSNHLYLRQYENSIIEILSCLILSL